MSLIVAIDPDFLLEASQSSTNPAISALKYLIRYQSSLRIALDSGNLIYRSYMEKQETILEHEMLRIFWQTFLDDQLYVFFPYDQSYVTSKEAILREVNWLDPVKPQLFSITQQCPGNVCILTHNDSSDDNIQKLSSILPSVTIWVTTEKSIDLFVDWLKSLKPTWFPDEYQLGVTVHSLINGYHIPAHEEPCYEFKQPDMTRKNGMEVRKLELGLTRDAMEAACAMLNSHVPGYVLIGVSNGPTIDGFDTLGKNNDEITCNIRGRFDELYPPLCNQFIVPLVLTLENRRVVAILDVLPSGDKVFVYDNTFLCGYYVRTGTSNICTETVYYHGTLNCDSSTISYFKDRNDKRSKNKKTIRVSNGLLPADCGTTGKKRVIFALSEDKASVTWIAIDNPQNCLRRKSDFVKSKESHK